MIIIISIKKNRINRLQKWQAIKIFANLKILGEVSACYDKKKKEKKRTEHIWQENAFLNK